MTELLRARPLGVAALIAVVLTACSSSGGSGATSHSPGAAQPPTSAPPSAPASSASASPSKPAAGTHNGRANLTLTGAVSQTLRNAPADCNYYYPGMKKGVVYEVGTSAFLLQVSDSEGTGTGVVLLNVNGAGGGSYTNRKNMPGTIVAKLDRTEARLDLTLRTVVGTRTVHAAGTITCPA